MEDYKILDLFWSRNEQAITESKNKYGTLICSIAFNILRNRQDTEECENDTYIGAWNTIPPTRPQKLSAYLAKLSRNIAITKFRANNTKKRGGGEVAASLHELDECIPDQSQDKALAAEQLSSILNEFLASLSQNERQIFMRRYWKCDAIGGIAKHLGCSSSKVKMTLLRTREKLRKFLEQEGIFYDK
ncbi:MAG: sigma-70 family RNA polymerase sigma factor [Clostridia bacterium]|nr:sigma-70 family RNA polymerase sigma factor [Clostridia bacterium]